MASFKPIACENSTLPMPSGSFFGSPSQLLSPPLPPKLARVGAALIRHALHSPSNGKAHVSSEGMSFAPGRVLIPTLGRGVRMNARNNDYDYDYDDQESQVDIAEYKLLEPGTPGTHQAIVKSVMPVGFFLDMPSGRTAYLPSRDIGVSGGVVLLRKVFKIGQELTVRIVALGGGRDIVSIKKPEYEPPPSKYGIGKPINQNPNQQSQSPNQYRPNPNVTPRSRQPYPRERRY